MWKVEGQQGQARHPGALSRQRHADRRGDEGAHVAVEEHVVIARVVLLAREQREPVQVRGQPGADDDDAVPALAQALGREPRGRAARSPPRPQQAPDAKAPTFLVANNH
jgi:hypothetical protein